MGNIKLTQEQKDALEDANKFGAGCTLPLKCDKGETMPMEDGDIICAELLPVQEISDLIDALTSNAPITGLPPVATDLASALTLINFLRTALETKGVVIT